MNKHERIAIYGAGDAGRMISRELAAQGRTVVGFIDDDDSKQSQSIDSLPVLGRSCDLASILVERNISRLLLALPSAPAEKMLTVFAIMQHYPEIEVEVLPKEVRYFSSPLINELKPSEFEYLFGRDELTIDYSMLTDFYRDASVLVTGAGGSIGSELCRNLLRLNVRRLICLGRGENSIYELAKSLSSLQSQNTEIIYHIADIRDYGNIERIFSKESPDYCFHAAAHKHVPFMEDNIYEAIHNNCMGSDNLFKACIKANLKKCILVSTDKAVAPTSVMGATKNIAEQLAVNYSQNSDVAISAVRFGNVIGSRGSVLPLFKRQIASGEALTVTDERMERYFMSITEATLLMLNALTFAGGSEIFVLDMGKPHKIIEIARRMLELSNKPCIAGETVLFTGLRPGEKLTERLFSEGEKLVSTDHPRICAVNRHNDDTSVNQKSCGCIIDVTPDEDEATLRHKLFAVVQ